MAPVAVTLAFIVGPLPGNVDGATICWPIIGPRTEIDPVLTGLERKAVEAHEAKHREQCVRDGPVHLFLVKTTARKHLAFEMEANCAQALEEIRNGSRAQNVELRMVDELAEHPWHRRIPIEEIQRQWSERCSITR